MELVKVQNQISLEKNLVKIGNNYKVLVEGEASKGMLMGRLEDNTVVNFINDNSGIIGKLINIKITDAKSFYLTGEKIEPSQ